MNTSHKSLSQYRNKAFTLIEVVIFIAISSIILITIVSLSISIIRQTTTSHHKLYAARYADELAEWLRIQKEISWQDFYTMSQFSSPNDTVYCINSEILLSSDLTSSLQSGDCPQYDGITNPNPGPKIFKRTITFQPQPDNKKSVKGTIRVEWQEANNTLYFVQVETLFAPR
jgi:type II secretory pathway pseudopilin PulG